MTPRCGAELIDYSVTCQRALGHDDYWLGAGDWHVGFDKATMTHVDWDDHGNVRTMGR